jgi:RNA polymerase sigma-70 factor (ECF subfamily)
MNPFVAESRLFDELIRKVRAGDSQAAAELVRLYEPAIRRAARIRLVDSRLRRLFDSMDISQSVFASFFVRAALGQYELDKPDHLLRLLVTMSRKKLAAHARAQTSARRDYRRLRDERRSLDGIAAPDTPPDQKVAADELLHMFRERLSDDERQVADLRVLGKSWEQIAASMGGSAEGLRKKLSRAVGRIAHDLGLDELSDD